MKEITVDVEGISKSLRETKVEVFDILETIERHAADDVNFRKVSGNDMDTDDEFGNLKSSDHPDKGE